MILFDGVDIRSVADVKIEDIRVSAIQIKDVVRDRPIAAGATFVRPHYGTRTVTVTFALLNEDRISRHAALMAINAWARSDKEYKIELPQSPDFYLVGVCTAKPDPSVRQWWESKLRLVFTCYENPFWTSKIEKSVACGTSFTVFGDAEPLMRIEHTRTQAASGTYVRTIQRGGFEVENARIRFASIPAGNMVIDLNSETAKVNSISIMDQYVYYSAYGTQYKWIVPMLGQQKISGDGTIKYRERWM